MNMSNKLSLTIVTIISSQFLCTSLFAEDGNNIVTKKIDLKARVRYEPIVCKDNAFLGISNNFGHDSKLMRVDLATLTTKTLLTLDPDFFSRPYQCDRHSGNYFVTTNNDDTATLDAYTPDDQKLWQFTFDLSYPQIEDVIVADNKDAILVRLFHLRKDSPPKNLPDELYSINKTTGKLMWKMTLNSLRPIISAIGNNFYISDKDANITAYNIESASLLWIYKNITHAPEGFDKPLQLDSKSNTLVTGYGSSGLVGDKAEIIGINAATGDLNWQLTEEKFIMLGQSAEDLSGKFTYANTGYPKVINWIQLPVDKSKPSLISHWQLGYEDSAINKIFRSHDSTVVNIDKKSSFNSQVIIFNNKGDKQGTFYSKGGLIFLAQDQWHDWWVYATRNGQFGLLRAANPITPHKPTACPDILAIQSVGIHQASFMDRTTGWVGFNQGTNENRP